MEIDLTKRPRTKRPFSDADILRMRDLYYDRTVPMLTVADAFGVPVSTFLRWMAEMGWPRRSSSGPGARPVYDYADGFGAHSAVVAAGPDAAVTPERRPSPAPANVAPVCSQTSDLDLAAIIRQAAQRELAALGTLSGAIDPREGFAARKRRADVIESLSRSIARIDRVSEERDAQRAVAARVTALEAACEAHVREKATLARKLRRTERELAEALADTVARVATPAPAPQPQRLRPGQVTLPEYQQWWIDRGEEPP